MSYIVWQCCNQYDIYDIKDEAFAYAHAVNESDSGHRVEMIEGPNKEDLTNEFKIYDDEQSHRSYEAYKQANARAQSVLVGRVEVLSPLGYWCGESVYSESQRDTLLAELRATFGEDRVRFAPVP